ncbi:hypothetical protein [Oryza sativa Japonica Group]|uniref:Uncharacterized protein n=1 Tax=Oryza sativa subsp. japonica TaxID=39947 RepID=Q5ZCH5_ORYSJ|nr:hypothetical protein [Oryza sativa Japonica Group]BAD68636.1 hypothetical protein [Oryza sativa Japonica Group]
MQLNPKARTRRNKTKAKKGGNAPRLRTSRWKQDRLVPGPTTPTKSVALNKPHLHP